MAYKPTINQTNLETKAFYSKVDHYRTSFIILWNTLNLQSASYFGVKLTVMASPTDKPRVKISFVDPDGLNLDWKFQRKI